MPPIFLYEIIFGKTEPKMDLYFSNHCLKIHVKPLGVFRKEIEIKSSHVLSYITNLWFFIVHLL